MVDFQEIGLIGTINMSILAVIVLWRTIRWYLTWNMNKQHMNQSNFNKKLTFHLFLLLTPLSDIPLYVGFYRTGDYDLICYSFHKFETFFLFGALSIIISDWAKVLYDIQEYQQVNVLFRKWTLIGINAVYFIIGFVNFIILYTLPDLSSYASSPVYICLIFLQIVVALLLTGLMLHAGLKLYFRIHKASGNSLETNMTPSVRVTPTSTPVSSPLIPSSSRKHASTPLPPLPIIPSTPHAEEDETMSNTLQNGGMTNRSSDNAFRGSNSAKMRMSQQSNNSSSITTTTTMSSLFSAANIRQSMSARFQSLMRPLPTTPVVSDGASTHTASSTNSSGSGGNHGNNGGSPASGSSSTVNSKEFRQALRTLNIVMFTCTLCIGLQMIMTILNFAFGYAYTADEFVGPPLFYWTCTWFIPLWGPILALLYLARSTNPQQPRGRPGSTQHGSEKQFHQTPMKNRRGDRDIEDGSDMNDASSHMMNNPLHQSGNRNRTRTTSTLQTVGSNNNRTSNSTMASHTKSARQDAQLVTPTHHGGGGGGGGGGGHHTRSGGAGTQQHGIQMSQSQNSQEGPSYRFDSIQYDDESNISQMLLGEVGFDLGNTSMREDEYSADGHGSHPNSHRYETSTQASNEQSNSYSQYLYRDTTDTQQLPSELHLSNIFLKHLPMEQSSYYYQRRTTNQDSDIDTTSEMDSPVPR